MATSVKRLVTLANELHTAYTALVEHDKETARLHDALTVLRSDRRQRTWTREQLSKVEERATDRLAVAIDHADSDRVEQAVRIVGPLAYVFDGF